MNQTILQTLFLDNPELSGEIANFCRSIPEYVQADRDYDQATRELIALAGFERFSRFEWAMNKLLLLENRACCLFGPGLRQIILESLTPDS